MVILKELDQKKQGTGMYYRAQRLKFKGEHRFMAAINDLIAQIQDIELRNKIEQEVNRMNKQCV